MLARVLPAELDLSGPLRLGDKDDFLPPPKPRRGSAGRDEDQAVGVRASRLTRSPGARVMPGSGSRRAQASLMETGM